ncbi:MAG: hemerythrin domain-containing protein, partial [Myxococcales bacterium]|nr:hemerythrin domain-containing protein [Myxococcales bacterium]
RRDHTLLRRLLGALKATEGGSSARQPLFELTRDELLHHAIAEEQTLYKTMRDNSGTKDSALHSVHEHREIEELLKQLAHIGYDQPQWIRVCERLCDRVEHHLDEEEDEIFMSARNVVTQEKSEDLSEQFRRTREQLQADLPGSPFLSVPEGKVTGTLEARSKSELEKQATEMGIDDARSIPKSELITKIREAQGTARAFSSPTP